ncbi:MAG: hypothetical protein ACE1ZM_08315 [Gammaproteobacteria bacterium]
MRNKHTLHQLGQGMVEFIVVLVFGVMVMTIGPGGDVLLDLLGIMNDKYQGYSYATSLSTLPDHDNLAAYLIDEDIIDPIDPGALVDEIRSYTSFPTLDSFPDDLLPDSPSDILDGASSFF